MWTIFLLKWLEFNCCFYIDPRTKDWFLSGSPLPIVAIIAAYLYFVNGNGQRWMKHRKPFELTKIINAYNIFQVVCNAYVCVTVSLKKGFEKIYKFYFPKAVIYGHRMENYRFFCIPEPFNDFSPAAYIVVETSYYYYLLKVVDLLDTIFFILRKKNGQVSFLHIYHHSGMALLGYIYFKLYSGGGYATILGKAISDFTRFNRAKENKSASM